MRTISYSPPTARRPKLSRASRTRWPTLNLGFDIRSLLRLRRLLHPPQLVSLLGDRPFDAAAVDLVGELLVLLRAAGPVPGSVFRRKLRSVLVAREREKTRQNVRGKT